MPPPRHARSSFWLWGGILLTALAITALGLPFFLLRQPQAVLLTLAPSGVPANRLNTESNLLEPSENAAASDAESVAEASPSNPPPSTEPPPIVEHRHVQETHGPTSPLVPGTQPAARARRLDRSAEARQQRVRQFGGTANTEDAVEAGLAWLAAHQSPDGAWDRVAYQRQCPSDEPCPGPALDRTEFSLRAGLTGLTLLAFFGAGYTDQQGRYQTTVARGVNALLKMQQPDGGFSRDGMAGYDNTLATFALAEYYALTRSETVKGPLQRAADNLVQGQQLLGGWDYWPGGRSGRNDTSITAWAVQALQACAVAGLDVPGQVFVRAALHFSRATGPDGQVWYADTGIGTEPLEDGRVRNRYGPAMVAAGLMGEQLLGWRLDSPRVQKQQALLLSQFPSAGLLRGGDKTQLHSEYYWYYGTVAMFQVGGENWERWNAHLRDAILPLQNRDKTKKGEKKHIFGSWQPFGANWGKWGRMGGRVYSTALGVLTLEIYYRHTPAYLDDQLIVTADDWRSYLQTTGALERRRAVDALRELKLEVGEPVLVDLLNDTDLATALTAAKVLTLLDSPLGRGVLEQVTASLAPLERSAAEKLLRRVTELEALPPAEGKVRLFDVNHGLATLELPRAYVGMLAIVRHAGQEVARMRIIQRFTGRTVVLAELLDQQNSGTPQTGDIVTAR